MYEEDLTLDDAAGAVGVSQKTMQRRHVSALRKLRAYLLEREVTGSLRIDDRARDAARR